MAEYICREAIIDDLEKEIEAGNVALDEDVWINKGLRIAIRDIKDSKSADVQPVRHGQWEYIRNVKLSGSIKLCECSICHNKIFGGLSYCGNCGARMDGEK